MKHSLPNVQKQDKETVPVECICKAKVPLKEIIAHTKQCNHFKVQFGTLTESIDTSLKTAKDQAGFKVLFYLFSQAKSVCGKSIKENGKVPAPPPLPVPIVPVKQYPYPIQNDKVPPIVKEQNHEEVKVVVSNKNPSGDRYEARIEESSVFCKVCNTRFLDFNQIIYLEACMHPFCKEDLKKHIFK